MRFGSEESPSALPINAYGAAKRYLPRIPHLCFQISAEGVASVEKACLFSGLMDMHSTRTDHGIVIVEANKPNWEPAQTESPTCTAACGITACRLSHLNFSAVVRVNRHSSDRHVADLVDAAMFVQCDSRSLVCCHRLLTPMGRLGLVAAIPEDCSKRFRSRSGKSLVPAPAPPRRRFGRFRWRTRPRRWTRMSFLVMRTSSRCNYSTR